MGPSCTGLITAAGIEPTKGGACAASDPQLCYKTCGPEKAGVRSEICTGGVYAEMSGCAFDPGKDYSCYAIPLTANTICPLGVTPQASTACEVPHCSVCNSHQGLPGGQYVDSAGAPKVGYCVCQEPTSAGNRTWSCASDTAWPCPLGAGCLGTSGRGGEGGGAGAGGRGGAGGAGGIGGGGVAGSTGAAGNSGQPACLSTVVKGGACSSGDQQLCYKTCGPEQQGVKSEICSSGVYIEMSGCSFDQARSYACYKIPPAANAVCTPGVTPQASQPCAAPLCTLCNSVGGLPGGAYLDSSGAAKVGYCVCQAPNSNGARTWSCASDTQWPCPLGLGC